MDTSGLVVDGGLGSDPRPTYASTVCPSGSGAGETLSIDVCVLCIHIDYVFIH